MILFDLAESESHPAYQALAISNGDRQFSFLQSIVRSAIDTHQHFLSSSILKALNFHAIACLHTNAGEVRPCAVEVVGPDMVVSYRAPAPFRVDAMMEHFVNVVNLNFKEVDAVTLAAFVLWRLCWIHPFINGNGRTARAAAYFVICVRSGGWLPGTKNMTSLLKVHRDYTAALQHADTTHAQGSVDLAPLVQVISECLQEQLASSTQERHSDTTDEGQ